MRSKKSLKYQIMMSLLLLMVFSALALSGCSDQPVSAPKAVVIDEEGGRHLEGFPPNIPHELERGADCLACHRDGELGQAPKTPHPEFVTCRQCHALDQE